MTDKRYFYVIALRGNTNAVSDPESNYRLASGQVRGVDMETGFNLVLQKEGITLERDSNWTMRNAMEYYRNGQRVSVYISPMSDDMKGGDSSILTSD